MCAVFAVIFAACQPIFAGGEGTDPENDYNKYGKVDSERSNFRCAQIDENTTRIYLAALFVNTSVKHIKKAVITVEFIDIGKYPPQTYYEPVATYTTVVENIGVGRSKWFTITADITVENAEDRLDILVNEDVLYAYFHKIEWEISNGRPDAADIKGDRNFI
jgi:hypothetical protein